MSGSFRVIVPLVLFLLAIPFPTAAGQDSAPPRPPISRTIRADGHPDPWGDGEYGFPFGSRLVAVSSHGRPDEHRIVFPFLDTLAVAEGDTTRVKPGAWRVGAFTLHGTLGTRPIVWGVGDLTAHGPVVAGPDNTFAFLVQSPFPDAVDPVPDEELPEEADEDGAFGFDDTALPPAEIPANYIRMSWCQPEKAVYYRLPPPPEQIPRSRSALHDLWFGANPQTKKMSLFALLWDGTLCVWELRNGGKPPATNVLRVDDPPRTINVFDVVAHLARHDQDAESELPFGPLAVAEAPARIAVAPLGEKGIWVLDLSKGKVELKPPHVVRTAYQQLLLSPNGAFCAAFRAAQPAGTLQHKDDRIILDVPLPEHPNVVTVWNARDGTLLWEKSLPGAHFVSRAAFSPDGTQLITWSCPARDLRKDLLETKNVSVEEEMRREEARHRAGVLTVWNSTGGTPHRTWSFPLSLWPHGMSFTPDGKFLAVLEHGGTCHLIEAAKLTKAP